MSEPTFFVKAKEYNNFNQWVKELPLEDLALLSSVNDDVSDDKLEDKDTFAQIPPILIWFSGKTECSEKEMEYLWQAFRVALALEINVREGKMKMTGKHSLLDGSSARFSLTEKGMQSVRDMLNPPAPIN